jgi:hypothetical protein
MKRFVFIAGMFALAVSAVVAGAQVPATVPAQPGGGGKGGQPGAGQPGQPGNPWGTVTTRVTPAKMALMEEECETLEAARDVKKAYVHAAEVTVRGAEVNLDLISSKPNIAPQSEVMKAKLDVEAAKAQLEIRMAEMKEVEVKIKFAKKRLDDAKVNAVRPAPTKIDPKPVDPIPPGGN